MQIVRQSIVFKKRKLWRY